MNPFYSFFCHPLQHYKKWDSLVFILLTFLSVLYGGTTVFYVIYFFWWNELLRILVDRFFYKRNPNVVLSSGSRGSLFGSLMQMAIYWIFIVVFFGVLANWSNKEIAITNMGILFFQNWFFNLNLIFILVERIYLHRARRPLRISFGQFTPHMIVLHISIILGAIVMFFIVKNFPETFTPDNLWGSVLIVLPFLLLKMVGQYFSTTEQNIKEQ